MKNKKIIKEYFCIIDNYYFSSDDEFEDIECPICGNHETIKEIENDCNTKNIDKRLFLSKKQRIKNSIIELLQNSDMKRKEIVEIIKSKFDVGINTIDVYLKELLSNNQIVQSDYGVYSLKINF